jgi:tRNA(fMet)-specific endonuclease VapC
MFVLDTDTLTHWLRGHARVSQRRSQVADNVVLTVITRIEVLQGRFAAVLKAPDGDQLQEAQDRLTESERQLANFDILLVNATAAAEFERLLSTKGLRRIGRGDLLIASISLAYRATLVTRNRKRGRPITEDGSYRLFHGLNLEDFPK